MYLMFDMILYLAVFSAQSDQRADTSLTSDRDETKSIFFMNTDVAIYIYSFTKITIFSFLCFFLSALSCSEYKVRIWLDSTQKPECTDLVIILCTDKCPTMPFFVPGVPV